ncbi:MAG: hypothetical protein MI863_11955 [Desulfobacterales bacterium]|nr:hypothetical protein [Desulfobacterales bacterium]
MKINKLSLACVAVLLFLTGCVIPQWKVIEKPELTSAGSSYRVQGPVGWIQLTGIEKHTFITREGPSLQAIEVQQAPMDKAFEGIDIEINDNVLISELAQFYVADFKAKNQGLQVSRTDTMPFTIDGKQGFKVTMEFRSEEGLVFDIITCGLLFGGQFYTLVYHAPRLHYFERDLPVFNRVVASFEII